MPDMTNTMGVADADYIEWVRWYQDKHDPDERSRLIVMLYVVTTCILVGLCRRCVEQDPEEEMLVVVAGASTDLDQTSKDNEDQLVLLQCKSLVDNEKMQVLGKTIDALERELDVKRQHVNDLQGQLQGKVV